MNSYKGSWKLSMIEFVIPGEPVAQGRPRATTIGGRVRMYDPAKSKNYKKHVSAIAKLNAPKKPLETPLRVKLDIYRPMLKSMSKKRRELANARIYRPITKPDNSNYAKGIEDALNGIIYKDDSQIVDLIVRKYYSDDPRVEVLIEEVE